MFDVSFNELALIGIVALLVVGPQKLPALARSAGVWIGKTRRMIASVKAEVDRELKTDELRKLLTEQQAEVQELRQILDENRTAVEADIKQLSSELNAATETPGTLPALDTAPNTGTQPSTITTPPTNPGSARLPTGSSEFDAGPK